MGGGSGARVCGGGATARGRAGSLDLKHLSPSRVKWYCVSFWDLDSPCPLPLTPPHLSPHPTPAVLVFPATLAVLNTWWYYKIVKGALKVLGPKKKPVGKTQ